MKRFLNFIQGTNKPNINALGDIKKLPRQNGVLLFPISMDKISGDLSAENIFKVIEKQIYSIWNNFPLSIIFLYTGDVNSRYNLGLKSKFDKQIEKHKLDSKRIINYSNSLNGDAFSFLDWDELFNSDKVVKSLFSDLKKIYLSDEKFQSIVKSDLEKSGIDFNSNNINFLLEEMILPYLFTNEVIDFKDIFTKDSVRFKLNCYSSNCSKSLFYLQKRNFFNMEKCDNVYRNCFYNFKDKFLFDFDSLDFDNFDEMGEYITSFRK